MGQCQSNTSSMMQNAVTVVQDKTSKLKKSDANNTTSVGVLPNKNQELNQKQNLIEMHAKLSTQYFHSNVVTEWHHRQPLNAVNEIAYDDNMSSNTSTSASTIEETREKDDDDDECCSESVLSEFSSITQKISQEKKQQKLLDKQISKDDKKFISFLLTDFQELQQKVNDDDENRSVVSNISMNLKDNSTWYIDFTNMKNDNNIHALPDNEASSLGESTHSLSSSKHHEDEKENQYDTSTPVNYKVQRRRRIALINNIHNTPSSTAAETITEPSSSIKKNKSVSTFSISSDTKQDDPLQRSLYELMNQQEATTSFDIYEMDDGLHPLDIDSEDGIDTVPCSIQISINQ